MSFSMDPDPTFKFYGIRILNSCQKETLTEKPANLKNIKFKYFVATDWKY